MVIAKSQGHGVHLAHRAQDWLHTYLATSKLPIHRIGHYASSLLDDEGIALSLKLHLQAVAAKDHHF
jgi:hypothetical protein